MLVQQAQRLRAALPRSPVQLDERAQNDFLRALSAGVLGLGAGALRFDPVAALYLARPLAVSPAPLETGSFSPRPTDRFGPFFFSMVRILCSRLDDGKTLLDGDSDVRIAGGIRRQCGGLLSTAEAFHVLLVRQLESFFVVLAEAHDAENRPNERGCEEANQEHDGLRGSEVINHELLPPVGLGCWRPACDAAWNCDPG